HRQLTALNLGWGLPVPQASREQPARQALAIQVTDGDPVEVRRQSVVLCRRQVADIPSYSNQLALAVNLNQFGVACHDKGRLSEAEQAYREALDMFWVKMRAYWPDFCDPVELFCCANLGIVLRQTGRYQEAEQILRKGISTYEALVIKYPFLGNQ